MHSVTQQCVDSILSSGSVLGGYYEEKLISTLMKDYSKLARPVENNLDPVNIQLGLSLQQIIDVVSHSTIVCFQCFGWPQSASRYPEIAFISGWEEWDAPHEPLDELREWARHIQTVLSPFVTFDAKTS